MTVLNQNNREDNLGRNDYNDNIFGEYFVFRDPRKLKIWFSKGHWNTSKCGIVTFIFPIPVESKKPHSSTENERIKSFWPKTSILTGNLGTNLALLSKLKHLPEPCLAASFMSNQGCVIFFLLWFWSLWSLLLSCITKRFLGRYYTHVYTPQTGNPPQTKVQIPPKYKLMNQWVLLTLFIDL